MLYGKFDNNGNLVDISENQDYLDRFDLVEWDLITGFTLTDINFAEETFKKDEAGIITLETIMAPSLPKEAAADYYSFIDSEGRQLSEELYYEGGGVSSPNTSGWFRRFNGMVITNTTGMFFGRGAVIEMIEFTCGGTDSGRRLQLYHYDKDGGDGIKVYDKEMTLEDNQFLFDEDLHLYIPPLRRFAAFMTGASFRYPQYRIGYRRVF